MAGRTPEPNYHGRKLLCALRKLREEVGWTQDEAGTRAHMDFRKLSRVERKQLPSYHELIILLDVYGVLSSEVESYVELLELARAPGWWAPYKLEDARFVSMEDEAESKHEFQLGYIPTLLQTEEYAQSALRASAQSHSEKSIRDLVEIRMRQQQRLIGDHPIVLRAFVHEPVLWHKVNRQQTLRLIEMAERPNITLRVVPRGKRMHPGQLGSAFVLKFAGRNDADIAFAETMFGLRESNDPDQVGAVKRSLRAIEAIALDPRETINRLKEMI